MKGSDISKLTEINLLADAINNTDAITFADNTEKDAFLVRAKLKLEKMLAEFTAN